MKHIHDAAVMISLAFCMALIYDPVYFLVDLLGNFLAVASGMCQISSDKYLITHHLHK